MAKKIVWTATAQNDRKEIFGYWNKRNKSTLYSLKLNHLFNESLKAVSVHPHIGKLTNYQNTRVKIVRDYLIVYRIYDEYISVISIWDGRQNPLKFNQIFQ
ncbi:MAG: type II toxin-antitoxin system RelE/ParE family toxin [Chitinophagaceae bacterium]|nr:type II toxin-antitoxin system RelE/ParE family toxin [Chitinophagaceae bacterium]